MQKGGWREGEVSVIVLSSFKTYRYHNSAWRPRRVDDELGPGGRGKELAEEGLNTLRARRATVSARLDVQH